MVSMLTLGMVDHGFESRSGKTIKWVFVASPLRKKYKNWLAQNQDNVSEWGNMSIRGLLFQ
jgi:hypothetical protein